MKIALLYAYWLGEPWSNPLGFRQELERRGHDIGDFNLYHDMGEVHKEGEIRKYSIQGLINLKNAVENQTFVPDVVINFDYGVFDHPAMDKKYFPGSVWILESGDDPQAFRQNYQKAHKFHAIMTPDYQCADIYKQNGHKAYWMPHCSDTTVYYPMHDIQEEYDCVTTCGSRGKGLTEDVKELLGNKFLNDRFFWGLDHARFMNRGKMVFQCSQYKEITRRIFEGMSCGKLMITDRLPEHTHIEELFEDGKDIVFYDNARDAADKIKYYAEHDAERAAIAQRGMEKVWEYHSTSARVDKLLDITNEVRGDII